MDDAIDVTAAQGGFEPFPIGEILVEHAQVAALRDDARDPGALHGGIVIIVEIVDADHGLAAREQPLGYRCADEARHTRYQHRHRSCSPLNVPPLRGPDRKSTRLNSSHSCASRMPSSA